jgi:hypothetical protein
LKRSHLFQEGGDIDVDQLRKTFERQVLKPLVDLPEFEVT